MFKLYTKKSKIIVSTTIIIAIFGISLLGMEFHLNGIFNQEIESIRQSGFKVVDMTQISPNANIQKILVSYTEGSKIQVHDINTFRTLLSKASFREIWCDSINRAIWFYVNGITNRPDTNYLYYFMI